VWSSRRGFIAVIESRGERSLVCGVIRGERRWVISEAPGALLSMARAVHAISTDPDGSFERLARAALARWLAARLARQHSGGAASPSVARRRLLALLDASARRAAVHSRAALAQRLVNVRSLIASAVSAGAERTLFDLERGSPCDLETLLVRCESLLAGVAAGIDANAGARPAIRALLLLRGDP
jgi:hypothetical protein